ncbi:hypothetical protein BJV74DRAFT_141402 [Russula compacta]|nr:hypothetical protein BJV74DRAFT_141402 [Russula compacta]
MALVHDNDLGCINNTSLENLRPDALISHLRTHAPTIQQVQCELLPGDESTSGAEAVMATVATLSKVVFETPREGRAASTPSTTPLSSTRGTPAPRSGLPSSSASTATPPFAAPSQVPGPGPQHEGTTSLASDLSTTTASGYQPDLPFKKYMKNIRRGYRKQAMELISVCRTYVQDQEQTPNSGASLRNALQLANNALKSAAEVGERTSLRVDKKFKKAIKVLSNYEKEWRFKETVTERMTEAKTRDKAILAMLNVLKKEKSKMEPTPDCWSEPTNVVEFHLFRSLPDDKPTVVRQMLCKDSNQAEILWNFGRCKGEKRLTLKQNPHFYKYLPRSKEAYGCDFRCDPIYTFEHSTIMVLTDNLGPAGRVFLDGDQKTRAFGNVWVPNRAIIFKDVYGKLEGESVVREDIRNTPNLWYFMESPLFRPSVFSQSWNCSSSTVNTTLTNATAGEPIRDWKECSELIHRMVRSQNVNIHITTKPPSHSGPSSSALSALISDGSRPPIVHPQPRPPIKIQIPEQSTGLPTPSNYESARSTPLSKRTLAAELSSRTPTPSSAARPAVSPSQLVHMPSPPSPTALFTPVPRQPPMVASPPAGRAISALPAAPPLYDVLQKRPTPQGALPEEALIPSQAPRMGVPTMDPTVTATASPKVISSPKPHVEGGEGEIVEHAPNQVPVPFPFPVPFPIPVFVPVPVVVPVPEDKSATSPPSDPSGSPPPIPAQANAPQPPSKRNWFRKYVWNHKK